MKKNYVLTLVFSVLAIVLAIVLFAITIGSFNPYTYGRYSTFGADYYTYAIANMDRLVRNTGDLVNVCRIISYSIDCIMFLLGGFGVIYSAMKLKNNKPKVKKEDYNNLKKLKELLDVGVITNEEYDLKKQGILDKESM